MKSKLFTHLPMLLLCCFVFGVKAGNAKAVVKPPSYYPPKCVSSDNLSFVDAGLSNFPQVPLHARNVFQLISHGRPGALLLEGKWRNEKEIATFIRTHHFIAGSINQLNIYGCEFAKGAKGKHAVAYLQKALSVSIAASDNVTGKGGDWKLEIGKSVDVLAFPEYPASLQYNPSDDLDGDGITNVMDIDDDNDGIMDADESNACYFRQNEIVVPALVTSQIAVYTLNPLTNAYDTLNSTYANFLASGGAMAGVTVYEITPKAPIAVSSINFNMINWAMTATATSTVMLQGFNGTSWDTLGPIAAH